MPFAKNGRKFCSQCGEEKSVEDFQKDKSSRDGLRYRCRKCQSEYGRRYQIENKELLKQKGKQQRQKHAEKIKQYSHNYNESHKEQHREWWKIYSQVNKERLRQKQREHYHNNRSAIRSRHNAWRKANQDKARASVRNWRLNHPDRVHVYENIRRAQKNKLPFLWAEEHQKAALEYWHHWCAYCGNQLCGLFDIKPHFDHYIPIVYKGKNNPGTTPWNMLPACSKCNHSKRAKMPEQWVVETFGKKRSKKILMAIHDYFIYTKSKFLSC